MLNLNYAKDCSSRLPSLHYSDGRPLLAQDARELEQERTASKTLKGEHPLLELIRTRKSTLRPELLGVHPRVYVTDKELAELRQRSRSSHGNVATGNQPHTGNRSRAAASSCEQRRQQNDVGIAIAEAAFVYKIEGERNIWTPRAGIWTRPSVTTSGVMRTIAERGIWPRVICFTVWPGAMICFITISLKKSGRVIAKS